MKVICIQWDFTGFIQPFVLEIYSTACSGKKWYNGFLV